MVVCPTCDRDDFATERAMRIHHTLVHDETLSKTTLTCERCGEEYEELACRAERSRFCSKECKSAWESENRSGENSPRWKEYPRLNCEHCGTEYEVIPAREDESRFCSKECLDEWRSEHRSGADAYAWEGGSVTVVCVQCSQEFDVKPVREETARFCSRNCMSEWQGEHLVGEQNPYWQGGGITLECDYCGDKYELKKSEADGSRFCSRECLGRWQSEHWTGEDAPAWKGGSPRYYGPSWRRQRERALERDDHQCVICGKTDVEVHHVQPFRTYGVENHDDANRLENLVCLCPTHHNKWEGIPVRPDLESR